MDLLIEPGCVLRGEITLPGDKSISHRALILSALASGNSILHGFLESEDCLATLHALGAMGVHFERRSKALIVKGVGLHGLRAPTSSLDCQNAGTSMRLLAGVLAGFSFESELKGDNSLSRRPMERIVIPLRQMGAKIEGQEQTPRIYAPLKIWGKPPLSAIRYPMPVASAQVKSCLLLAGLYARSKTVIIEKKSTRDHTERLMKTFGCPLKKEREKINLFPCDELKPQEIYIPGDISSAAFFIAGACMSPGSHVMLRQVGINPTRTGIISIFKKMGANITIHNRNMLGLEPVADIEIRGGALQGVVVPLELVPIAIDEFPIIFVAASSASGKTIIRGIEELRHKETDRIQAMVCGLKKLNIKIDLLSDGIIIYGSSCKGGTVNSFGDHRVAMAFAMAGLGAQDPIRIKDCNNIGTSFPNFCELAKQLGMTITRTEV